MTTETRNTSIDRLLHRPRAASRRAAGRTRRRGLDRRRDPHRAGRDLPAAKHGRAVSAKLVGAVHPAPGAGFVRRVVYRVSRQRTLQRQGARFVGGRVGLHGHRVRLPVQSQLQPAAARHFDRGRCRHPVQHRAARLTHFQARSTMKHSLTFIAVGLIAISLIGCASPAQSIAEPAATASPIVSATSTPVVAASDAPIKLEDCTIGTAAAKCGTYRVYENRSAGSGRQIDLKIAVLPATTDRRRTRSAVLLRGRPRRRGHRCRPHAQNRIPQVE